MSFVLLGTGHYLCSEEGGRAGVKAISDWLEEGANLFYKEV